MVKQLQNDPNATIPDWMAKLVAEDDKRGKMKWAAQESKRLKAEGKDTPQWMEELVVEDAKWANRWAACKSAQLHMIGEEVPAWMVENARKGVMEAAKEQIEELDEQRDREVAVVSAQGDAGLANERMLARSRTPRSSTKPRRRRGGRAPRPPTSSGAPCGRRRAWPACSPRCWTGRWWRPRR